MLLQPLDQQAAVLREVEISKLIRMLQSRYDYIVLDLGHDNRLATLLVQYVNHFCLVINQDLPSVYLTTRKIQLLKELGCSQNQIQLIVNGYAKSRSLTLGRIAKAIKRSDLVTIRQDEKRVLSALNQGIPLGDVSKRGKAYKDMKRLTERLKQSTLTTETAMEEENTLPELMMEKTAWAKI